MIISTSRGLYRYQLHDLVEVVGSVHSCPLLHFVGKAAHIADHFGEKVNAFYVQHALDQILARARLRPSFVMLACDTHTVPAAYTLYIEAESVNDQQLHTLGVEIERSLQDNYHYRYCPDLGQLAAARVFRVTHNAIETYAATCQMFGQRASDMKPVTLHTRSG